MKHIIFGGDGFVGRHLAERLVKDGEEVVIADIVKSDLPHYGRARFVHCDVTDLESVQKVGIGADDMVYNMAAKMLSPLQIHSELAAGVLALVPCSVQGTERVIGIMRRAHGRPSRAAATLQEELERVAGAMAGSSTKRKA